MRTTASRFALLTLALTPVLACNRPKSSPEDVGGPQYLALESEPATSAEESARARETHAVKTAFVIVMENHGWSKLKGHPSAPYINDVLFPASASADQYRMPSDVRPSEPNYVWMEAGDSLGIGDNDNPDVNHRTTRKHLTALLDTAGVPWKSYQQGISGAVCPLTEEGTYQPKHNPMVFFTDVTSDNRPSSERCISHVRPETELAADLASGSVAGYVFITPDRCHNMHDKCASGDGIKNGDDFLAKEVPMIQRSAAYRDGGAIFVVWDENEGGEGSIPLFVLSPHARAGYRSQTAFSHSSLLRTMQEIFAVGPLLRDADKAASLGEVFSAYP